MKAKMDRTFSLPALGFSWPLIVALGVAIVFLGFTTSKLLQDPDSYLHISAGRWILQHQTIPSVDIFSHTKQGEPWTAHEWLAELILALCYQWGGWTGPVLISVLAMVSTLAYLLRYLLGKMEPIHALLFTALAGAPLAGHLLVRPHVLAWPLLAIWICQLVQAVENQRHPPWWLLGIMVLWANLHGGFTLGLALIIPLTLEVVISAPKHARWPVAKPWIVFILASTLAAMATPSGWKGIWFTFQLMNLEYLRHINEWGHPKSILLWYLEGWMFLLLALAVAGRLKTSPWRLLPVLGLWHLSLAHVRSIPTLALLAPFFLATPLAHGWYSTCSQGKQAETLDRFFSALVPKARWPAILLSSMLISGIALLADKAERYQPATTITPADALRAAQAVGVSGQVLNEYGFGGFLIFQGIPVFIDGRADMYGDTFLGKYFRAQDASRPENLSQLLDEYNVTWTLLQTNSPTARQMDELPGWKRIHQDKIATAHKKE